MPNLFGLFGRSKPPAADDLATVVAVPRERRDAGWTDRFYRAVPDAALVPLDPLVANGPDGFPYAAFALPSPGLGSPSRWMDHLPEMIENGWGAVILPTPDRNARPHWVFSYGDLLAWHLFQNFRGAAEDEVKGDTGGLTRMTLKEQQQVLVGAPSQQYYPTCACRVLGRYIRARFPAGRAEITLLVNPALAPARNLMLGADTVNAGGDAQKMTDEMRRIRWFLPHNHGLLAHIPNVGVGSFVPLE